MKRLGKATGRTLLTALLAFAAALLAFFGVMFGIMPKDMYEVRAAGGEPVAIKAELQAGKDVYTGMTLADLANSMTVTLVDDAEDPVGDPLSYDMNGTSGFKLEGDISVDAGRLSQTQVFTVSYGAYPSVGLSVTVQYNRVKELTDVSFSPTETIYSNTDPSLMNIYLSATGVFYNGETTKISVGYLSFAEYFVPGTDYSGTDPTFSKTMTVRYTQNVNGTAETVEKELLVEDIHAVKPDSVSIQKIPALFDAYSELAQYANEVTIRISYPQPDLDNNSYLSDIDVSLADVNYSNVKYGDANGKQEDSERNPYTSFVYGQNGRGTLWITYTELEPIESGRKTVNVARIETPVPMFSSDIGYQYSVGENGLAVGTEQNLVPRQDFYADRMEITGITKEGVPSGEGTNYTFDASSVKITDAGTYEVTISLTNDAYKWQGREERSVTVTLTVNKATLQNLSLTMAGGSLIGDGNGTLENPYYWNHGESVPQYVLEGNYGAGKETPIYEVHLGGTVTDSAQMPTERGTYKLRVSVAETTNFIGNETSYIYFQIGQRELKLPSFMNAVYNGQAQFASDFLAEGSELWATYEKYCDITAAGGALSLTDKGTLEITFTIKADQENNAKWAGLEETVYKASFEVIPLKIVKPTLTNTTYVYNTKTQTWTLSDYNAVVAGQTGVSGTFANALALTQGSGSSAFTLIDSKSGTLTAMNAGSYSVTVALNNDNLTWEDGGRDSFVLSMTIQKKGIAIPTLPDGTYTYKADAYNSVTLSGFYAALMGIEDITAQEGKLIDIANGILTGKNAGKYTVRITLNDSANYCWTTDGGSDVSAKEISWTIAPLAIGVPTAETPLVYNAAEQTYSFGNTTQDAHLAPYSVTGDKGTNARQYTATFTLTVNNMGVTNYIWSNNSDGANAPAKVSWTISPDTIETAPVLAGDSVFSPDGMSATIQNYVARDAVGAVMTSSGSVEGKLTVNGADLTAEHWSGTDGYSIVITLSDNYVWDDEFAGVSGQTLTLVWKIERLGVTVPSARQTVIWDREEHNYDLSKNGSDFPYTVTSAAQAAANEAGYAVTFTLNSDDYCWGENSLSVSALDVTVDALFVIERATLTVPTQVSYTGGLGETFNTYNYGQDITALPEGYQSAEINYYSVTENVQKNAGSYSMTLTTDANHKWTDGNSVATLPFSIGKLALSAPTALTYEGETQVTYRGETYTFTFENWNRGDDETQVRPFVLALGYGQGSDVGIGFDTTQGTFAALHAGTYKIVVSLSSDNFVWKDAGADPEFTVTILPYLISVTWNTPSADEEGNHYTFNNAAQAPAATIADLFPIDAGKVSLTYTGDTAPVNVGQYTITINGITGESVADYTIEGLEHASETFRIGKYTLVTSEVVGDTFFKVSQTENPRYIEYNGAVQQPSVILNTPEGLHGVDISDVVELNFESADSTNYDVYWFTLTLLDTYNYIWEVTPFTHPTEDDTSDSVSENVVWLWYQITKTLLDDGTVGFRFDGNAFWTYGSAAKTPVYNSGNYLQGMTYAIYYYGTPYDETYNGGWQSDTQEYAIQNKVTTAPTHAGEYYAVLVLTTSEASNYATYIKAIAFTIEAAEITLTFTGEQFIDGAYASVYGTTQAATVTASGLQTPGGSGTADTFDLLGVAYSYGETGSVMPKNVGEYTVTVTISNKNYALAETTAPFNITKATLTVRVENASITYGEGAPAYTLVYSGWQYGENESAVNALGVTYAYSGQGTSYQAGSDVGIYYVTPAGLTADNYDFTYLSTGTLTVKPKGITLTVKAGDKTYDGKAVSVSVTAPDKLDTDVINYVYTYTKDAAPMGAQSANYATNAGEWTVTVTLGTGGKSDNYVLTANGTAEFTIDKASLTIKFASSEYTTVYGEQVPAYALTYSGWVNGEDFSGQLTPVFATKQDGTDYAPGATNGSVGAYNVTVTELDGSERLANYDYTDIATLSATLTVEARKVSLTLGGLDGNTKVYDAQAVTISVTPSAQSGTTGLLAEDSLVYAYVYTWSGGAFAETTANCATDAGEWTVTVTLGTGEETGNYTLVGGNTYSFTITKAQLTVKVSDSGATFYYGDTLDASRYSAEITGWKGSDEGKDLLNVTGYTTQKDGKDYAPGAENGSVGAYTVTPILDKTELTNYTCTIVTATLNVTARPVTVTVNDVEKMYGDTDISLGLVYEAAGLSGNYSADFIKAIISFTCGTVLSSKTNANAAGYTVTAEAINGNYAVTFAGGDMQALFKIEPAQMTNVNVTGYAETYDSEAHEAAQEREVTLMNDALNSGSVKWYFRLADGEWSQSLTLENAGTYTVYYYVTADNHAVYGDQTQSGTTEYSFTVTIDKYALSVKADATTTYGEAFDNVSGYTLSYKYGAGDWTQDRPFGESLTEMGLGGEGAAFKLAVSSDYLVGDNAGAYAITLSGAYEGNYDLTLSDGTLTVKARAITVTIDDKTGTSGSTYGNAFNALTASVTEGNIYETDGVATVYDLITLAVYNKGAPIPAENEATTNVGYYLIVGTYAADSPFGGDVPVSQNYTITFKGSQDFGDGTQNAGQYQVNPKNVGIKLELDKGVEEDSEYLTYDGTQKGYKASFVTGQEIAGITFVYLYEGTTEAQGSYNSKDRPTEAGSYTVTVTASSENYNFTDASTDFTISKATYTADNSLNVLSLFGDTDYTASVDGTPLYAYLYLYDGQVHRPDAIESYLESLAQEGPADGSFPSIVSITEGKVNRYDDGDNTVTIGSETHYYKLIEVTFKAGSDNYQAPASMKFIVVIRALEVEVEWGETEYIYDGTDQIENVQPVYYILNDREQSPVSLALSDTKEFRAAGVYSFTAVFAKGDNANQNYVLKTSGENSHTQQFTMRQREVNIAISDDSMQYGDTTPAASTEQGGWWNYADDNAYTLVEGDQIVITVSAKTAAQGGQAVTCETGAGEYFLVAVASSDASSEKDVLGNYVITFTGSRGENGQFTVEKRAITVNIGDVSSVYGNAQSALAAALAEGSALSAASKDAGPNGETLTGGEKPVIELATSVSIKTATPVGRYVVYGTLLESGNYSVTFTGNADHEGTGNAGEYTVTKADFTEGDFTFAGYGGEGTFYDANAHRALDSYELTNELSAAYLNGLTLEYFVTKDAGDTQDGTSVEEFMVTHVAQSGTYYFYVVAKTSDGIECYERKTFAFTVDINTAANEVTQEYLWSNLEYGVTADDKNITPIGVRFGSAELAGFYQGGELVAATETVFKQKIAARSIGAGDYTVRFTVAGSLHDGAYDYGDADGDTFECTVNVAKYTVTLVWSGGNSLMYSGSEQLNTLQISDSRIEGEHWMANAFTTYFAYVTNAGGGSLSYAATGYPQITAMQAGAYSITLSLTDAENYRWADMEDGTEKTFTFNISAEANSITVTIRDGGWTYGDTDGLAQEAIIGEESSAEDLFISFTVTAPGTYVYLFESTDGEYRSSTVPTDAGEYTVTVTVLATTSYGEASDTKTFTIAPKKIAVPYFENSSTDYNGLEQRNRVVSYQSGITWVSGLTIGTDSEGIYAVATNAGDYTGTLTIINANYVWNDETGGTDEREIVWTIAKGVPQFEGTLTLANNSWTYGEEKTASPSGVTAGFAGNAGVLSVVYKYFRDAQLVQECDVIPTDAGTYYVAAYVAGDGKNYDEAWLMADGQRVSVSFTIERADYDLSGLVFDLADWTQTEGVYSYVYDGKAHAPEIAALPNGLDGIGLKVAYSGEVTDVSDGTVTRTATFSTESGNYKTPEAVSVEICIAAREVSVVWEQTHYTYNGKVQQVSAYFLDVNEGRQTLTVNIADGAFMDYREEGYQATAVCTDANYRLSDASQTLFIDRLAVTVTIDNAQATYGDEDIASPALSARENVVLPDDAALVYTLYIEGLGEKVNAGTYAICGRAEGERAHNYSLTFTNGVYTVARRQVTVNIDEGGGTYGETITPASIVSVSALANGDTRETALDPFFVWTYSGTAFDGTTSYRGSIVPTLAGNYSVTLTLAQSAEDMTCNYTMRAVLDGFTVARKIVEVPVLDGFFYNGTEQSVQTQAEQALEALNAAYDGVVSLAEENVYTAEHAGDYVVTFRLADTANYRWNTLAEGTADAQVGWQIRQAQASDGLVVSIPTLAGWVYDNTAKTPVGSVLTIGGETIDDAQIVYVYSSKRSELPADHHFEPYTDAGTYYVRAYVAGTDDYAQIYSEPLEYTISQAKYDLSGLSFAGETHVFNGADYAIALSGTLPVGLDGIGVTAEYTLDGQNSATPFQLRNAGEYEITVTLHSASKNYVSPDWTRTAELIIQARTVNVHWDKTQFTYNGSEQTVTAYYIDVNDAHCELAVTIGEGKIFRDVGEYSATASFVTPDANYALRETQTLLTMLSASIVVRILPQEFFYSGSMPELDQSAYRIETQGEFTNLNITLSAADSTGDWNAGTYAISASWENDNYAIEFVGGTLEILPAVVEVGITLHENLTYDGTAKTATAQILSGVVAGETLSISLVYSGTANNGSTWYSTEAPVFAGSYSVRAVISSQNYSLDSQATATAFTIARAVVALPAIDSDDTPLTVSTEKTGEEQRILIPIDLRLVGVLEAVAGTGLVPGADGSILLQAMEEGTYGVTLYLRDADNYAWSNGSTDNLSLEWTIVQNGLDPIFWVMIALGAALLIELIVLAAYFLSGGANGGKGGDDDANDGANNDGNDDGNNEGEETPSDDVRGGADSAPAPQQSGKTVTASVAAPVLFGLLAITEWQIAGVALLAAAVAAFLVIDIVLYSRRAAKNKTEETETVSASRKEPVEEAPEEVPAPEEEPVEETPEEVPAPEEEPVEETPEEIPVSEEEPVEEVPEEIPVSEEEPVEETPEEDAELAVAVVAEEPEEEEDEEDEEDEEPEDENVGSIESNVTVIDGRKILVRYNYSFRAKLIQSGEETQERFGQLMDEFSSYPQVKTRESWRQVRVYSGRKTLACILFKGRKLCVAFALDPKQYEETKYRGKDMSEIKRYEKTPMLLKVFSERKLSYAKYLFAQVAAQYGLRQEEVEHHSFRLPYQTTEALIEEKLVKLYSNKELSEDAQIVKADIATLIREKISMREAQSALSDEVAAMYLEEEEMPQPQPEQVQEPDAETQPMQTPSEPVPVKEAAEERKVRVKRGIINIDTLSRNFQPNEVVTLEAVRARKLVAKDVDYLKVLARGYIDKPLIVEAHDFSMDAVKMILLTGGRAIRKKK